jgi:predicted membrane chloride channel (bestrophin family)
LFKTIIMTQRYADPFGPPWKVSWIQLLLHWTGSIFQFLWIEWTTITLIAAGFCALVIFWFERYQDLQSWRRDTELLAHALDYVTQRFQAAISLMLGFYTVTLYNRWWSVRGKMQAVSSSIKDIALQLAMTRAVEQYENQNEQVNSGQTEKSPLIIEKSSSTLSTPMLPNKADLSTPDRPKKRTILSPTPTKSTIQFRNTARHVRLTMVRWVNLAHALAVRDLFEQYPNEFSTMERLQNLGLITDEEINHLQSSLPSPYDRYGQSTRFKRRDPHRQYDIPIAWVYEWMYQLDQSDRFSLAPILLSILNASLVNIRENLDALFMYRDTPVPLFYRQLVTLTIRLYMIIFLVGDGIMALQNVVDLAMEEVVVTDIDGQTTVVNIYGEPDISALIKTAYYMLIPFSFEYFVFVGYV